MEKEWPCVVTERLQGSVWWPRLRQSGLMTAEQRLRGVEG